MPTPYTLTVNCDIWTSNTEQKLQILEQICMLFNPSLEIQTTDNYIDWTSLSYVELTDITFSSRTIPVGADTEIDVASIKFSMPIWLSPPVKVKKLGVITSVIMSIFDESSGTINLGNSLVDALRWTDDTKPVMFAQDGDPNNVQEPVPGKLALQQVVKSWQDYDIIV